MLHTFIFELKIFCSSWKEIFRILLVDFIFKINQWIFFLYVYFKGLHLTTCLWKMPLLHCLINVITIEELDKIMWIYNALNLMIIDSWYFFSYFIKNYFYLNFFLFCINLKIEFFQFLASSMALTICMHQIYIYV